MTPVEIMAKAISCVDIRKPGWNETAARAALLALAEAEIPESVTWSGINAYDDNATSPPFIEKGFSEGFRAMIREIAKEEGV